MIYAFGTWSSLCPGIDVNDLNKLINKILINQPNKVSIRQPLIGYWEPL